MWLRHTAVTRMAEDGCELGQIASITGHKLTSVASIIEHYLVRTGGWRAALSRSGWIIWRPTRTKQPDKNGIHCDRRPRRSPRALFLGPLAAKESRPRVAVIRCVFPRMGN
jgi:hypothetical protein